MDRNARKTRGSCPGFGSILLTVFSWAVSISSAQDEEGIHKKLSDLSHGKAEMKDFTSDHLTLPVNLFRFF